MMGEIFLGPLDQVLPSGSARGLAERILKEGESMGSDRTKEAKAQRVPVTNDANLPEQLKTPRLQSNIQSIENNFFLVIAIITNYLSTHTCEFLI